MRMGNLRCARCGRRGHLANELARCHHERKDEWAPLQLRIEKQLGQTHAVLQQMTRATSTVVTQLSPPIAKRSSAAYVEAMMQDNDAMLPSAKDQLADCWRQRLLVFPSLTKPSIQKENDQEDEEEEYHDGSDGDERGMGG
ncbi:hypothetical protein DYB30_008779 [Aphanomyces astaci]|uniref:Uncharacterized protein n=1 Tax=Aphanomyces astaci TaxID=112090 RepID=A0A397DXK5_APHAT|nr:hypothetical protein DYB30_008779 [Aphanomyces astaci]